MCGSESMISTRAGYLNPCTVCSQNPTSRPHQGGPALIQKSSLSHHVYSVRITKPPGVDPGADQSTVWISSPISQTHRLTTNEALCFHAVSDSTVSAQLENKVDPLATTTSTGGVTNFDPNPDPLGRFVYDPSIGTRGRGVDPPGTPPGR